MSDAEMPCPRYPPQVLAVSKYHPALWQYFRRRARDQSDVDDLIQEVFVRVLARGGAEPIHNFAAYVFQVAASVLADRHRRSAVRHEVDHVEFNVERHSALEFDAAHILENRQALRAAVVALQSLPDRTREIFILRRIEGHAYRDIADRYGITVSAVEKHMVRAIHHLVSTT